MSDESCESNVMTLIARSGSSVSVFAFPSKDVGEIKIGVAINNEYQKKSFFNIFPSNQPEKAIQTLLKCGGSEKQLHDLTNFLNKKLRIGNIEREKEISVGIKKVNINKRTKITS